MSADVLKARKYVAAAREELQCGDKKSAWQLGKYAAQIAPAQVGIMARQMAKKATIPALVLGGFLIGLCTVPCSGAVYLGVLSLLALQPSALLGYGYLVLYNLIFVLPLIVILIAASACPALNRLAR